MRSIKTFVACLIVLISANTMAQYKVKVVFEKEPVDKLVYFSYDASKKDKHVDSSIIINGEVMFSASVNTPRLAFLWLKGQRGDIAVFLEDRTVEVRVSNLISEAVVKGGKDQELYNQWKKAWRTLWLKSGEILRGIDSASKGNSGGMSPEYKQFAEAELEKNNRRTEDSVDYLVSKAPNSAVSAMVIFARYVYFPNIPVATKLYDKLGHTAKKSYYGQQIKNYLDVQAKTSIGKMPRFSMPDADGKIISLTSFKGQYVLVDFWASWCGPCRKENPTVKKAYALYKDKGFTVLGASLDTKKDLWQKAIADDGLTWPQVCDLQGNNSPVIDAFGIKAIPFNFLIDKDGKIVARNLRGEALLKTLDELIK